MDIEKLIEAVRLCGSTPKVGQCKQCAYWSGGNMSKCIPKMTTDAATALSTLRAENEQLRAELEQKSKLLAQQAAELERRDKLLKEQETELERVKRERSAAAEDLRVCSIENRMECQYCLYRTARSFCWDCTDGSNWQWRGQKEG